MKEEGLQDIALKDLGHPRIAMIQKKASIFFS
jgi:hypothetical protein